MYLLVAAGAAVFTARQIVTAGLCRMRRCSDGKQQDERRENCTQHDVLRCWIWFSTEFSSSRRGLGGSWVNAGGRGGHHTQPSDRNGQCCDWKRVPAGVPTWQPGHAITPPRAAFRRSRGKARPPCVPGSRGRHDGRKGDPQHSRHKGEHRQDTSGQGDHVARIRGSRGSVRPLANLDRPRLRYRNGRLFRIFQKYRLTSPGRMPR